MVFNSVNPRKIIASSQAVSSASNFVMSAFAILFLGPDDFVKWCIYSVSALILQGTLRNTFLEPDFSLYGTVTKWNMKLSLLIGFVVPVCAALPSRLISNGDLNQSDIFFIIYASSLIIEDSFRYKYLSNRPKRVLLADFLILVCSVSIFSFVYFFEIAREVKYLILIQAIVQLAVALSLHVLPRENTLATVTKVNFTKETHLAIQSIANLMSMLVINFISVGYLNSAELREYRIVQLFMSPIQALVLLYWLTQLDEFKLLTAIDLMNRVRYRFKRNMLLIVFFTLIYFQTKLLPNWSLDFKLALYCGFLIVWFNAIFIPLNLVLRKLDLYGFLGIYSLFSGILSIMFFYLSRDSLSPALLYAVPLILQIASTVLYFYHGRGKLSLKLNSGDL